MRRILGAGGLLLILAAAVGGCDRRKDEIPTRIESVPKEQPQPVHDPSPD